MICRKYRFHGRVQGVGFRATTAHLAQRFSLSGTVKNCPDGTVELIVCGSEEVIGRLLAEIADAFPGHIDRRDEFAYDPAPHPIGFRVLS